MKTISLPTWRSKAAKMFLICAISLPMMLTSCSKNNAAPSGSVSEDEAAEIMTEAIDPASGGLVLQTNYTLTATLSNANPNNCGIKKDTTINVQGGTATRSYSYNLNWGRLLTCNGGVPSAYAHTFSGSSAYTAPRMSSNDSSTGSFTVTGLEPSSTELTLNQAYERNGSQQSKVRNQRSFNSKVTVQTTNLKVNKATRQIISGSGTVSVSGSASTGESFSYSGTLTYMGNNKATLAISGGNTYTIQW